jgi:hypothetical protein
VGVDDERGAVYPFGILRLGRHFVGWSGWGLGASERRKGEK